MKYVLLALSAAISVSSVAQAGEFRIYPGQTHRLEHCTGSVEVQEESLGKRNFSLRVVSSDCNVVDWGDNYGLVIIDRNKRELGRANGGFSQTITYRGYGQRDAGNYAETFHAYTSVRKDEVKVTIKNSYTGRYDYVWVKTGSLWRDDRGRRY